MRLIASVSGSDDVTCSWNGSEPSGRMSAAGLLPLVYDELRKLAHRRLAVGLQLHELVQSREYAGRL